MVTSFVCGTIIKAAKSAPFVGIDILAGDAAIMVLAPHPDDESLGCGAAIAAASASGRRVIVTALTDGAGSHPNSRTHPPARLAALRERELRNAITRLTGQRGTVIPLGYPDQNIPNKPKSLQKIVGRLLDIVDDENIDTLWTSWEGDPHCDHQMAAIIARQVTAARPQIALWRFPIWGRFTRNRLTEKDRLVRFDIAPFRRKKAAAIAAHRSQMTHLIADDPNGFIMAPETQRHFRSSPEYFITQACHV